MAATLLTNGSSVRCVYCNEPHYSASCARFHISQECKSILIRSGRCFNCLRANYKSQECESSKTCRFCNRKHHQSICKRGDSHDACSTNRALEPNTNRQLNQPTTGSHDALSTSRALESNTNRQPVTSGGASNTEVTVTSSNTTNVTKNQQTVLLQIVHTVAMNDLKGSSVPDMFFF